MMEEAVQSDEQGVVVDLASVPEVFSLVVL
jgi:hypothetical protein